MTVGRFSLEKEINRMRSNDDPQIRKLANVIDSSLKNMATKEEKQVIEKIERLRKELSECMDEIPVTNLSGKSPAAGDAEEDDLKDEGKTRTVSEICIRDSKARKWAFLLFRLLRETRPKVCLEMGTAVGISACYQTAALQLNKKGKLVTLEGAPPIASVARKNFKKTGLKRVQCVVGRFQETLDGVLEDLPPIDYVFIDGHHQEEATIDYYKKIRPHLRDGAMVIFDDINWTWGMRRAWKTLRQQDDFRAVVDMYSVGLCIFSEEPASEREYYKVAY